jgi:hypothetical protein
MTCLQSACHVSATCMHFSGMLACRSSAPAGSRYVETGARTKIARIYHATALLTKYGDIFVVMW